MSAGCLACRAEETNLSEEGLCWPCYRSSVCHLGQTYVRRNGQWGRLERGVWVSTRLGNGQPQPILDAWLDRQVTR